MPNLPIRACWIAPLMTALLPPAGAEPGPRPSAVVLVVVDTLRADRLSAYGYSRPTSPNVDALLARGARFTEARTSEPLTAPAMATMLTGLEPHQHGTTRNGLRVETGLVSLPRLLAERGFRTAAFVGSWVLRDQMCGFAEHFQVYEEVLTRKRWFGMFNREAEAHDLTGAALDWVRNHRRDNPTQPPMLWVHYIEPHAPYRFHDELAPRLGITATSPGRADRYDTEVAAVDLEVGRLVEGLQGLLPDRPPLIVFLSDHGENLGERGAWGHGRLLYEQTLRIPLGVVWEGVVPPSTVAGPALIVDLPTTVLRLLGVDPPPGWAGRDWSAVLRGETVPVLDRTMCVQAHRGAVQSRHESDRARSRGLLRVGVLTGARKEIHVLRRQQLELYDLDSDPGELANLASGSTPSAALAACLTEVIGGLDKLATPPGDELDPESLDQLRALGYLD